MLFSSFILCMENPIVFHSNDAELQYKVAPSPTWSQNWVIQQIADFSGMTQKNIISEIVAAFQKIPS